MQIATGSYVGDGTDGRTIPTGLSGLLRTLDVHYSATGGAALATKNDNMPGTTLTYLAGDAASEASGVSGLTFSGPNFIVDESTSGLNTLGATFAWTAWSE